MANSLTNFKSVLAGGGARPNLFKVSIEKIPGITGTAVSSDLEMLCKAASLPESTVGLVEIPFRGRTFKVAGDRTFAPWSITVINDTNFLIRNAMEDWMQLIAQYKDGSGKVDPADYMTTATVAQLIRSDSVAGQTSGQGTHATAEGRGEYKFYDIWPTNVSAIDLSYDSSDTIEEFTVEFQVNYWAPTTKTDDAPE